MSWLVVRQAYGGHYTENITFGPFDTAAEAQVFSTKSGVFGRGDAIVESKTYRESIG